MIGEYFMTVHCMGDCREATAGSLVESTYFKRVPGGLVFQMPRPWMFGPPRRYFVSEVQKAEILAVLVPDRPTWKRVAVPIAVILALLIYLCGMTAILVAFGPADHDVPTTSEGLMIMAVTAVPMIIALLLARYWRARAHLRRLQPLLADLPLTEERIGRQDLRAVMIKHTSLNRMLVAVIMGAAASLLHAFVVGFGLGVKLGQHQLSLNTLPAPPILMLIVMLTLTARFFAMAIRKAKQSSSSES
jgi:hypothetical protein